MRAASRISCGKFREARRKSKMRNGVEIAEDHRPRAVDHSRTRKHAEERNHGGRKRDHHRDQQDAHEAVFRARMENLNE